MLNYIAMKFSILGCLGVLKWGCQSSKFYLGYTQNLYLLDTGRFNCVKVNTFPDEFSKNYLVSMQCFVEIKTITTHQGDQCGFQQLPPLYRKTKKSEHTKPNKFLFEKPLVMVLPAIVSNHCRLFRMIPAC